MTTTIEAPPLHSADSNENAHPHRVVFSDPDELKATAVRDLDAARAAQAPVFSYPL